MPIRPSVGVSFSLKILIYQFHFWCTAFLGRYPCTVKIWILLNHPKGNFNRSEKSNLAPFLLGRQFSQKLFDNFFSIYARSFPRKVLMNCQKMD